MKKSIYFLMMFVGLALISCEPMEDIHEEVDNAIDNQAIDGVAEYTLTEDDYKDLQLNPENSFNSLEDASSLIPGLLAERFPVWGEGSLAQVTFDLFAPITPLSYTVSESDYATVGLDVNYFANISKIKEFLSTKYPQAKTNEYVELTYRTVAVEEDYTLTEDDFDLIGDEFEDIYSDPAYSAGRYSNFERRTEKDAYWTNDMILEALNVVMDENFAGIEGQTYDISYKIYDGSPGSESMKVRYDGSSYVVFGAEKFELEYEDYSTVADALGDKYPDPTANAKQYGSFTIADGNANFWSQDMILEAINVVLMDYFPTANDGAKFNVTYKVYNGSGTEFITASVALENGVYIWSDTVEISTIVEEQVYAYGDGSWMMPQTLPANIYTEQFEQRYNNFGNEADAGFYIGRYLEPLYPYAMDGDFISVAYDFYSGGLVTRYASFIYNDREWNFIPSTITNTLQFGYEGSTGWVVDNTITYTLSAADYAFIGEEFADEYDGPAYSAGRYNNFDRREGNDNEWNDEMLIEAMEALLTKKIAPDAEVGQKYLMTFAIYNGSAGTEQLHLIKTTDGWIKF